MPGHILGRYRLVKRLAVGGMADIYLAQQHGARGYERTVVLKTLREDLTQEEEVLNTLLQEAKIASCLRHPNIVELYEVGNIKNTQFLAMEFVFGRDLGQVRDRCLERGLHIPYHHVVTLLADLLDALQYAHHEAQMDGKPLRVIHRDISPQNMILAFDGRLKLLDFGLAKAQVQVSKTRAGILKGKYAYLSPEQVEFKALDHRADIFGVGVVFWELLTQRRLFYRDGDYETVQAVVACDVPFARAIRSDIPWRLAWIASKALKRNPRRRYATAQKMRNALLGWDKRSREQARDELAEWLGLLFEDRLFAREQALHRAHRHPSKLRMLQDAGFELVEEEPTDPELRNPLRRGQLSPALPRRPSVLGQGGGGEPHLTRAASFVVSLLGNTRYFLLSLLLFVGCGFLGGFYLGTHQTVLEYGYLNVYADQDNVTVEIDGTVLGTTPLENIPLTPGAHQLLLKKDGTTQNTEVRITAGEIKALKLRRRSDNGSSNRREHRF